MLLEEEGEVVEVEVGVEGEEIKYALALQVLGVNECALGYPTASGPAPFLWAWGSGYMLEWVESV